MPDLFIITGSNGAGKSTVGPDYLPDYIKENYTVFDGDLLYTNKLSELFPEEIPSPKYARLEALNYVTKLFNEQTSEALAKGNNYVYEGHFTNDETWESPKKFKASGYTIHLIFFGLENPELSQLRVTERVSEGGHYVDKSTLEANFYGNLEKLNIYHPFINNLTIVDTSEIDHKILFKTANYKLEYSIAKEFMPGWFITYLPSLLKMIR